MNGLQNSKRAVGKKKETLAAACLSAIGYQILECNFYSRAGEIDLIARDGVYLVFIEVKYRKNASLGCPEEAVGPRKIRAIVRTAEYYLYRRGLSWETPCRFDVVGIMGTQIRILKNAFSAEGM